MRIDFVAKKAAVVDREVRRVRAACLLLDSGVPRADVRAHLMKRFSVSRATAYRIIETAIEARTPA